MCGIVGVITGRENRYDLEDIISKMSNKISHRGPDGSGKYLDKENSLFLGHQRLSIIDLSNKGNQPMVSFKGNLIIAFNGEIYNHKELKKKLDQETKILWKGNSDTEILLNSIEFWGLKETLEICSGMFAFALFDKNKNKFFLVRDRFGEKPIYWGLVGDGSTRSLIFSSEISALKEFPTFNPQINIQALDSLIKFKNIPSDLSIYQSINKLKPAHMLEVDFSSEICKVVPKVFKWWSYENLINSSIKNQLSNKDEILNELEKILSKAISNQSIADVPIGCFLSSGIDSSLVVSLLSKIKKNGVNTFTIGFNEKKYSEADEASKIAKYLGTNHSEIILDPNDAINLIPKLPEIYSEPFADPSQLPTSLICREAKKSGLSVVLTGDGGDEMFGGYVRHFLGSKTWDKLRLIPYPLRNLTGNLFNYFPSQLLDNFNNFQKQSLSQKLFKISKRLKDIKSYDELYQSLLIENTNLLYHEDLNNIFENPITGYYNQLLNSPACLSKDPVSRMMFWDAMTYLPDDILVKVDRASMAESLETRAPFLDHNVAEFAWRIPTNLKVNKGKGKLILKDLLAKYLPEELIAKKKSGFAFPVCDWLRGPLKDWGESLIDQNSLSLYNHFSQKVVRKLWNDHINYKSDNTTIIWPILIWQQWLMHNK